MRAYHRYIANGASSHGSKADGIRRLFNAAQEEHKAERERMEQRKQEEMEEDARDAFHDICRDGKLTKRTIMDLGKKLHLRLSSEEARDALKKMDQLKHQDGKSDEDNFEIFKKWWRDQIPSGRRAVLGGGFVKYFADLRRKLNQVGADKASSPHWGGCLLTFLCSCRLLVMPRQTRTKILLTKSWPRKPKPFSRFMPIPTAF
eukprot:COSAG05_NODE_1715_length_4227_cov_2.194525_4_plen_203_part_00